MKLYYLVGLLSGYGHGGGGGFSGMIAEECDHRCAVPESSSPLRVRICFSSSDLTSWHIAPLPPRHQGPGMTRTSNGLAREGHAASKRTSGVAAAPKGFRHAERGTRAAMNRVGSLPAMTLPDSGVVASLMLASAMAESTVATGTSVRPHWPLPGRQ